MICPTCRTDTRVLESRKVETRQYRHRLCNNGHSFVTMESVAPSFDVEGFRRLAQRHRPQKETA